MRISQNLSVVGGGIRSFGLSHTIDANIYVINTGAGLIMIDAGSGLSTQQVFEVMAADGLDPRRVAALLLTHSHLDHIGGASEVYDISGCEVFAPAEVAPFLIDAEKEVDESVFAAATLRAHTDELLEWQPLNKVIGLDDGDEFTIGPVTIKAHVLAGHSRADLVIGTEVDGMSCLFTGDLLHAMGKFSHASRPDFSPFHIKKSLEQLSELSYTALFPGHGCFCLNDKGFSVHRALNEL